MNGNFKEIIVLGGTGFIGSRFVELLLSSYPESKITVVSRNLSKAARLAVYPVEFIAGNATDENFISALFKKDQIVINLAHDFSNPANNIVSAGLMTKIGLEKKIGRFIYISSTAVFNSGPDEIINEKTEREKNWSYATNKTDVENILLSSSLSSGFPLVILRPSIVYGPFSAAWTIGPYSEMHDNRKGLPFNGNGICNPVYIDDLCNGIINVINANENIVGRDYNLSGDESITWKEFYKPFNELLGNNRLYIYEENYNHENPGEKKKRVNTFDPLKLLKSSFFYNIYLSLLKNPKITTWLLRTKRKLPLPISWPSDSDLLTFGNKGRIDISKAKSELGYDPRYLYSEGSQRSVKFIKWFFGE